MANLSVLLSASLITSDTTLSPSPQIITRSYNNPTFATAVVEAFIAFWGGGALTLPAATIFVLHVKNLGAGNTTVSFTPVGAGAASSLLLIPGAIFDYFLPGNTGGGISAVSTTAATTTEVYMAA
jgi:hypothetical protein